MKLKLSTSRHRNPDGTVKPVTTSYSFTFLVDLYGGKVVALQTAAKVATPESVEETFRQLVDKLCPDETEHEKVD